jgi:hypothetical protein
VAGSLVARWCSQGGDSEREDVAAERERIMSMADTSDIPIVVKDMRKVFPPIDGAPPKVAVRTLTLGISRVGGRSSAPVPGHWLRSTACGTMDMLACGGSVLLLVVMQISDAGASHVSCCAAWACYSSSARSENCRWCNTPDLEPDLASIC